MPTAATETSPVTMPKMYGKACRHGLSYGNLKSTVFPPRLVGYMRVLVRLRRFTKKNLQHTTYKAFAEAELKPVWSV